MGPRLPCALDSQSGGPEEAGGYASVVRSDSRWLRGYLIATTALFFGLVIVGVFVTLGVEDSIAGRMISGVGTVALFYLVVRRLRLLRID